MTRPTQYDGYDLAVVTGAGLSAVATGGVGLLLDPWGSLAGVIYGCVPWFCLWLLRPRTLVAARLHVGVAAAVGLVSLMSVAALIWAIGIAAVNLDSASTVWVVPTLAVACVVMAGATSTKYPWLPAALAALSIGISLVAFAYLGLWTASCPDCEMYHGHDPPTREFMLVVWVLLGGIVLSAYAGGLVLCSHAARLISRRAGRNAT